MDRNRPWRACTRRAAPGRFLANTGLQAGGMPDNWRQSRFNGFPLSSVARVAR